LTWSFSDGPSPNRTCPISVASGSPVLIVFAVWDVRHGCPRADAADDKGLAAACGHPRGPFGLVCPPPGVEVLEGTDMVHLDLVPGSA